MTKFLADRYFELQEYCNLDTFDQGVFKIKHDEYAKMYQGLPFIDQGEVNQLIWERYNGR